LKSGRKELPLTAQQSLFVEAHLWAIRVLI